MLVEHYKNVCGATKTTESFDKNMYLIQRTLCSHLLVTAVCCSALHHNDKELPCILPHITNLHEELALLKTIVILNQEPLGHSPLFAVYHPPRPQNQPTLNIPVQVSLLKSENTPAFYSDKSVSNSKPVRTRGPTHHGNSLTGKTINNFRYSWCLHQCFSGIRHNSLRHPGINSKTNINIYITY